MGWRCTHHIHTDLQEHMEAGAYGAHSLDELQQTKADLWSDVS